DAPFRQPLSGTTRVRSAPVGHSCPTRVGSDGVGPDGPTAADGADGTATGLAAPPDRRLEARRSGPRTPAAGRRRAGGPSILLILPHTPHEIHPSQTAEYGRRPPHRRHRPARHRAPAAWLRPSSPPPSALD